MIRGSVAVLGQTTGLTAPVDTSDSSSVLMESLDGPGWSLFDDSLKGLVADVESLIAAPDSPAKTGALIVCSGVSWSYPCFSMLKAASRIAEETKSDTIKLVVMDQDTEAGRKLTAKYQILVGTPVVMVWYKGKEVVFQRSRFKESNKLIGPFSEHKLRMLVEIVQGIKDDKPIPISF